MIINPTTWKNYISNHRASTWLDGNIAAISEAFSATKEEAELMETALGVDPTIFLILPNETMQPTLVHHFSKVPKNTLVTNDIDEFFCLLGWDQIATAIKINPETFFAATYDEGHNIAGNRRDGCKLRKVSTRMLRAPANKELFSQCQPVPNEVTIVRKCIPLPPAFATLILDITSRDAHQMGHDLARLIFDIENERAHPLHNMISSQAGKDLVDEILTWLFYAPRYPSLRMDCPAAFPGSKIDIASKEMHRAKLGLPNQNRPFGVDQNGQGLEHLLGSILERNIATMQELHETRREAESDRANPDDKGFAKLPEDVKNFLLAVASDDLENPAISIAKSGLDLLKLSQKNSITALSRLLNKQGRGFGNLSIAQANDITSINWFAQNNPFVGLSMCRMIPIDKSPSSMSALEKVNKLELLQKLELDKDEILNTLTDKSLHRPPSLDDVLRNLTTVQGILEIYLGPHCAIVQRLIDFKQEIKINRMELTFKAAADDQLLSKIQYIVDSRLSSWMEKMYANSDNLHAVPSQLIDFSSIIQSITFGHFSVTLPANLLPAPNNKKRSAPDENDLDKSKTSDDGTPKARRGTTNPEPNPKWKLQDGEKWEWFNKDPNNLRPKTVCLMYHILGQCPQGQRCKRAKTHCKLTNEAQIKETDMFIEDCRKNAKP